MTAEKGNWPDRERRTCPSNGACLDHAGIIERVYTNQRDLESLQRRSFVTSSTFKWTIGLLVSALVGLFGTSIYISLEVNYKLNDLSTKQAVTIEKVEQVKNEIDRINGTP